MKENLKMSDDINSVEVETDHNKNRMCPIESKAEKVSFEINSEDYSMKIKSEPSYKEMKTEEFEVPDSDKEEIHFVNKCSICHDIFSSKLL